MPATRKTEFVRTQATPSIVSVLTGWVQQGVQSCFAMQRVILDLAMRQNAAVMHSLRKQLTDPNHSPAAVLSEAAGEGVTNFIEGQKTLVDLAKKQNEILMTGVKERIGDWPAAHALTELLRRSVDIFLHMQKEFLETAGKQAHTWMEISKDGKTYSRKHLNAWAREGMEIFVTSQKQFLDIIAEETLKAASGRRGGIKKVKKTEVLELAREATEAFIEAQKRFVELAGRQMNANVKTAGKTLELLKPFPFLPLAELTREGVKSYVDAQRALMNVIRPMAEHKYPGKPAAGVRRPGRKAKAAAAA
jgi:hypothetical protein